MQKIKLRKCLGGLRKSQIFGFQVVYHPGRFFHEPLSQFTDCEFWEGMGPHLEGVDTSNRSEPFELHGIDLGYNFPQFLNLIESFQNCEGAVEASGPWNSAALGMILYSTLQSSNSSDLEERKKKILTRVVRDIQ